MNPSDRYLSLSVDSAQSLGANREAFILNITMRKCPKYKMSRVCCARWFIVMQRWLLRKDMFWELFIGVGIGCSLELRGVEITPEKKE